MMGIKIKLYLFCIYFLIMLACFTGANWIINDQTGFNSGTAVNLFWNTSGFATLQGDNTSGYWYDTNTTRGDSTGLALHALNHGKIPRMSVDGHKRLKSYFREVTVRTSDLPGIEQLRSQAEGKFKSSVYCTIPPTISNTIFLNRILNFFHFLPLSNSRTA